MYPHVAEEWEGMLQVVNMYHRAGIAFSDKELATNAMQWGERVLRRRNQQTISAAEAERKDIDEVCDHVKRLTGSFHHHYLNNSMLLI